MSMTRIKRPGITRYIDRDGYTLLDVLTVNPSRIRLSQVRVG